MIEIDFVGLMEGSLIRVDADHPSMDKYWQSEQWILEPIEKGRKYQCLIKNDDVSFLSRQGASSYNNQSIINNIKKEIPNNSLIDIIVKESLNDLVIYDIIYWDSNEFLQETLFDRRKKLESIQEIDSIKISKTFIKDKYKIYLSLKDSYYGFYFKNLDSEYICGHLSSQWKILK